MNYAYAAYAGVTTGIFISCYPFYWLSRRLLKQKSEMLSQRMGTYPPLGLKPLGASPRIWIHAVSVGEVRAAHAVITALHKNLPTASIILSTATPHGYRVALQAVAPQATCLFAPIDFVFSVQKALAAVKPNVLVCMETEIWPNWFMAAHRRGIPIAIVNGRLSARSIRTYHKIKRLMAETLSCVNAFSMIHTADADRIIRLGAPPDMVEVNGNAKFDLSIPAEIGPVVRKFRGAYHLADDLPVIVAGSVRGEEPRLLLTAYGKVLSCFPDTVLVVAPRHMERVPDVVEIASGMGFSCQLSTELMRAAHRTAQIVVVDTMGELTSLYSIATVVFCGGSLVPLGGQNVLEAAAWGKPVIYGPFMEDFLEAKGLLERYHAGVEVKNEQDLAKQIIDILASPQTAQYRGQQGKKAIRSCQGAAQKHADVICRLL